MALKKNTSEQLFTVFNYIFLIGSAIVCLVPLIHVLAVSFSASRFAAAGQVGLWPKGFTLASYKYVMAKVAFVQALRVSLSRLLVGVAVQLILTILMAYPLSKEDRKFKGRTFYVWLLFITMLFNGGLIPTYMVIRQTGLLDTLGALVVPLSVNAFFIILLLNFFRNIPKELEEAAFIDGAGHWTTLIRIYLPTSLPALATITLFIAVFHWNSWFDGIIYMNDPKNYPVSSYLRTVVIERDLSYITDTRDIEALMQIDEVTMKAAQIFLGALPILMVYPVLQRYFVKGIVLGSVKG